MDKKIYEIDVSNGKKAEVSDDLYIGRQNVVADVPKDRQMDSDVTIIVQAYNRLEKTKECIESILKYTTDVNYDLLLMDNGSTDGTLEYFKSIDYDKVRILHLNKNISSLYPYFFFDISWLSKYMIALANDLIVTKNWLSNLLRVAESDVRIGMVNPVSSNVSNGQMVDLHFNSLEDMQEKAAEYNCSDPAKWHERLRLITLGTLLKKECLYAVGWPFGDVGFFHDFGDDDITFRVRRAGYKAILAKDTWIHHNHDVFHLENKDPKEFQESLNIGRQNFKDKYYGVDAWDDVNNFIPEIISKIKEPTDKRNCAILGVDVKCGTPILEIKNHLRSYGIMEPTCCAVTSEGKYVIDLQTVCGAENVFACSPENAFGLLPQESFDYIVLGEKINTYPEPVKVIKALYSLLKKGGQLFFDLKNTYDLRSFLYIIGYRNNYHKEYAYNMAVESLLELLSSMSINAQIIGVKPIEGLTEDIIKNLNQKIKMFAAENVDDSKIRLTADSYSFIITK